VQVSAEWNFAARLAERLGPNSCLIDAASGHTTRPADLRRLISVCGGAFIASGLRQGDRLLIGCSLSPSSALVYLAAIYAGLVAVPVDERALSTSAVALVEATGARAIWSEAGFAWKETDKESVIILQGDLSRHASEMMPAAACVHSDLAVLMATSGSTGIPRFVMVTHGNLIANTEAIIRSQHLGTGEKAMMILPLSYCFGASLLHSHLYMGGSVVFDRRFMFPDKVLQAMTDFNCTTFAGVPTVYNALLRRSKVRQSQMPCLKRFLQAGGSLAVEKINEIRTIFPLTPLYVMYGQTEATARISCMEPERWTEKPGSVGRPLDNLTVSIVDEDGNELPTGQIGELLVRGPSVCAGYWSDPEETRRVFRDGWLRTGDLARKDSEGYMWIEGRRGAFLKIRGTRISFTEVEGRVAALPGVYECGACSVDHPDAGEALVLLIVPDQGAHIDPGEIRRGLPAHWTLDSIRIVSELPKTTTGKLARPALVALAKDGHAAIA
jgi:acyl-CoA synthetase (AMP-forming)/AMP-acid ligase II